jgi:hypothetical protein
LAFHPKIKGTGQATSLALGNGKENGKKFVTELVNGSGTVVKHLPRHLEVKGSSPVGYAVTEKEREWR